MSRIDQVRLMIEADPVNLLRTPTFRELHLVGAQYNADGGDVSVATGIAKQGSRRHT